MSRKKKTPKKNGRETPLPAAPPAGAWRGAVWLLPLVAALVLPPLLLRRADMGIPLEAAGVWYRNDDVEFMTWWKSACIVAVAAWMLLALLWRRCLGWRPGMAAWGVLCLAPLLVTLLSVLASRYPDTVWIGFPEHYEGMYVCAGLLVMSWYASATLRDRADVRVIVSAMTPAFLINAALGIAQSYGYDFLAADWTAFLVGVSAGDIRLHHIGVSCGTLPNPNAFSRFMAMAASLALGMAVRGRGRERVFWIFCLAISLWALLTNFTRGGVVALGAGCLFLAAAAVRRALRGRAAAGASPTGLRPVHLVGGVAVLGILAAVGVLFDTPYAGLPNTQRLLEKFRRTAVEADKGRHDLDGVSLAENRVTLHTADGPVVVERTAAGGWALRAAGYSEEGAALVAEASATGSEPSRFAFPLLPGLAIEQEREPEGDTAISMHLDGVDFALRERSGLLYGMDGNGYWSRDIAMPKAVVFGGVPGLFSGRGYIWSRALGLLGERPVLGSGPDTFCLVFPNEEVVQKMRTFQAPILIDKADGSWVNILVTLGAAGALAWFLPVAYMFVLAWRMAFEPLAVALAAAGAAYAVGSVVTNSTVETAPCFWILCGAVAALHRIGADDMVLQCGNGRDGGADL